jgi:phage shock protein A
VGAVLLIVSIPTGYRMVQTQQHLAPAQSELENAKQAAEEASAQRTEIQNKLDEAASETKSVQSSYGDAISPGSSANRT